MNLRKIVSVSLMVGGVAGIGLFLNKSFSFSTIAKKIDDKYHINEINNLDNLYISNSKYPQFLERLSNCTSFTHYYDSLTSVEGFDSARAEYKKIDTKSRDYFIKAVCSLFIAGMGMALFRLPPRKQK